MKSIHSLFAAIPLAIAFTTLGCNPTPVETTTAKPEVAASATSNANQTTVDHSGWWCIEHGVPEEECPLCEPKLVADFKAKGDWCNEHQRPNSQCFQCDPKRFERFAARYEAKMGKKPPQPTE